MNIVDTTDEAFQEFLAEKAREYDLARTEREIIHRDLSWEEYKKQHPVKYSILKRGIKKTLTILRDEGCYVITDATVPDGVAAIGLGQEKTDVSVREAVRRTHLTPAREVQRVTVKVNKPREKLALRRELQKQRERKRK